MENKTLLKLGSAAGAIMAIFGLCWFVGEPALQRYVDERIEAHEEEVKKDDSSKEKFRHLVGGKMNIADDEVHIEIGKDHRRIKTLLRKTDSLIKVVNMLDRYDNAITKEMDFYHSGNLLDDFIE